MCGGHLVGGGLFVGIRVVVCNFPYDPMSDITGGTSKGPLECVDDVTGSLEDPCERFSLSDSSTTFLSSWAYRFSSFFGLSFPCPEPPFEAPKADVQKLPGILRPDSGEADARDNGVVSSDDVEGDAEAKF